MPNTVKDAYDGGICPDCGEDIPTDTQDGEACHNCGHVFYGLSKTDPEGYGDNWIDPGD